MKYLSYDYILSFFLLNKLLTRVLVGHFVLETWNYMHFGMEKISEKDDEE